jgi:hypothetical protein
MENKIKKTVAKKMISECKSAFKKICDSNKFDKTFFDEAFGEFENKINFLISDTPETIVTNKSKVSNCIINTGSSGSPINNAYVHQKGVSQKSDARSGKSP